MLNRIGERMTRCRVFTFDVADRVVVGVVVYKMMLLGVAAIDRVVAVDVAEGGKVVAFIARGVFWLILVKRRKVSNTFLDRMLFKCCSKSCFCSSI